jgi:hypothetical protein
MRYSPAAMARAKNDRSVLQVAYDAFERGDVVLARSLAQQVLAGKVGSGDEKAAVDLAKQLSAEGAPVSETPPAVAAEIISRTNVAPRTYLFVGAAAATLTLLAVLAAYRY